MPLLGGRRELLYRKHMAFALTRNITRIVIATVWLTSPSLAAEPKPELAIKTDAIDVIVTLDATIKAHPARAG